MSLSTYVRLRWRLLALALLIGAVSVALLGAQSARAASAAPARLLSAARPLVGCAPCISQVSPEDPAPPGNPQGTPATIDPDGKITITFSALLNANFAKFVFSLDGTQVDAAQIKMTDTNSDPTQPTGTYRAALSAGKHRAFVQAYDTNGPAASFGWTFTAPQAPTATPTATKAPAGSGSGGNTDTSPNTGSGGLLSPKTLSILLFSIAGVGLLVVVFIAGMWYGGRRWLSKHP